jgi:hypothetical protein
MKIKLFLHVALIAGAVGRLAAGPLAVTTAVHTKPDASSPAITYLKAGTNPNPAGGGTVSAPDEWMAIELPGPFEGYVESNKDLTKGLDVKPGASIRLAPRPDAGVLAVAEKSDKTAITGLRGKWTQISLEKNLTGYIRISPEAPTPAPVPPANRAPSPVAPAPASPGVYGTATPGQAAPMVDLGDGGSSALPRQFAGLFVSTRRPFAPRRPFDYALNDDAGKRYAYLDISKLLLTEQIEKYIDRKVVVFGAGKNSADGKDIVIVVESLQLK